MIDIHTHIIPGVDDGAKTLEMALEMIDIEIKNGVDTIVFTPHSFNHRSISKDSIIDSYKVLVERIKEKNLDIKCYLGQEIFYKKDTVELLKKNELLTMNNTKYILVEFEIWTKYQEIADAVYSLRLLGYEVIIAHVERYDLSTAEIIKLKKNDKCLLQINMEHILEHPFKAKGLLKTNVIDFVASDCHRNDKRLPNLDSKHKVFKKYPNLNKNIFEN